MMIQNSQELKEHEEMRSLVAELLYQLADDDFLIAYRGSEWLGLAPHIEEDVAFSSINQDTMGHAVMYYQLLEEIGEGKVDDLAHGRPSHYRKNAVLLELPNGPGHYRKEPEFDWAFTVVRHYFYTQAKKVKVDSLKDSSYKPLANVAVKINMELYYHLMHWKTWFHQLLSSSDEARRRMMVAIEKVCADFGGVLSLGPNGEQMAKHGLIEGEEMLMKRWTHEMESVFESLNLSFPESFGMKHGDGRKGEHTDHLVEATATLSEVYRIDPAAAW